MNPDQILDRTEACHQLGISRQTLISWIQKGKLKVWKRVGHGTNAALLFERKVIDAVVKVQVRVSASGTKKPQGADFNMPPQSSVS